MLFLALTTQTPCGLGILLCVVTTPHEICTQKFILVNCEQATSASTGDLENMGHRHDVTHKVLLVKCEEVPGDLKNNMGNVYMWPSEFARM